MLGGDAAPTTTSDHTARMTPERASTRVRWAPVLDLLCITSFVVVGGRNHHELTNGIGWFLGVMWPFVLGWFAIALATRLYQRADHEWRALAITWIACVAIAQMLRGVMGHPWISAFPIVALVYLGITTFGWRGVAALVARRRSNESVH